VASAGRILRGLRDLLPDVEVTDQPRLLPRGYGSEAWLVGSSRGQLIIKVAVRWPQGGRILNAAEGARLAARHGVRTPQALALAQASPIFDGRAYSVWEYLEGIDAEVALAGMSEADLSRYFGDLGRILGRLHTCNGPHYARQLDGAGQDTWADAVCERLARLERRYRDVGLVVDTMVSKAAERIRDLAEQVNPQSTPKLVHSDIYLDNLLVATDGSPIVLDFEHASFADVGFEFVKPTLFIFHHYPIAQEHLFSGYREQADADCLDARIRLALGLELVWGLPFFHHWNDRYVVDLYQSRLAEWLRDD